MSTFRYKTEEIYDKHLNFSSNGVLLERVKSKDGWLPFPSSITVVIIKDGIVNNFYL